MSTTIDMRVHLKHTDAKATVVCAKLVDAVSAWLGCEANDQWQDLRVGESAAHNTVRTVPGPMNTLSLKASVESLPLGVSQTLSTGIGFSCWRVRSDGPYRGFLRVGVECWDSDSWRMTQGRAWIEGNARLVISSVKPFTAALREGACPDREDVNRRVEENIEAFLQLLFNVAKALKPLAIKVFTDTGDLLPFNEHVAFYDTNQSLIRDLRHLSELWRSGIPEYDIPSFGSYTERHDWTFNELRSPSSRRVTWMRFSECIGRTGVVTDSIVSDALRSNDFDVYRLDEGFVVLNYPYCFNGFLDRFYCVLLEKPAAEKDKGDEKGAELD